MTKKEFLCLYPKHINNTLSFNESTKIITKYCEEINKDMSKINNLFIFLLNNPNLLKVALDNIFDFYRIKYNVCIISKDYFILKIY